MTGNDAPQQSLRARTLSGLGWSYLATVLKAFMALLALAILARLLAPVEYGLFGIAWIFMTMGVRFGQSLIGPAIIQRLSLTDRHIETGFTLSLIIGISMSALFWLLAPFIGAFFGEPTAARALQVLAVIFLLNGVSCVPSHLLRRDLRFRELMVAEVTAYALGYGFTTITLAFQGYGVWSLVWGEIMSKVVHVAIVLCYTRVRLYPRWSAPEARDLLSTGAGFSLVRIFEYIARQGGHFIIGRWLGAMSLGYYTRTDKLTLAPKNYLSQNLLQVLFPAMAQRQQGTERLATVYLHGLELLSLVAMPLIAMLFLAAPEIVLVILGGQWEPVIVLLQILALATLFQICDVPNIAAIGAVGAVYRQAWRQGLHALLVVSGAWYASRWGLQEVVMVIVCAQVFAYLLSAQLSASVLKFGWNRLMRCFLPALWAGAWAVMALWPTALLLRSLALPALPALAVEALVWLATVIAAIYFAPVWARSRSLPWTLINVPFETLGPLGHCLSAGLKWLSRQPANG